MAQSDFWNKLKKRLREVSTAAADFTEEQAMIRKLKFDILNLRRKIDHKQREIGVRVCDLSKEDTKPDALQDGDIVRLLSEIEELEIQIAGKRVDISKVTDQVRSRRYESETAAKAAETIFDEDIVKEAEQKPPTKEKAEVKPKPAAKKKSAGAAKKGPSTKRKTASTSKKKTVKKAPLKKAGEPEKTEKD